MPLRSALCMIHRFVMWPYVYFGYSIVNSFQWNHQQHLKIIDFHWVVQKYLSAWIDITRWKWVNLLTTTTGSASDVNNRRKICLSLLEACLSCHCVSGTMFAPGTLLQTGAPPGFCYSMFLPLFAQRLRAIIGANTLHYSYLCTHTGAQKRSACKCAQAGGSHLCTHVHRLPPLSLAWRCVLCCVFCFCWGFFVRCFEASHSWQHLWKVWHRRESPGKQIGECRRLLWNRFSLSTPLLRSSIRFPSCREQTLDL